MQPCKNSAPLLENDALFTFKPNLPWTALSPQPQSSGSCFTADQFTETCYTGSVHVFPQVNDRSPWIEASEDHHRKAPELCTLRSAHRIKGRDRPREFQLKHKSPPVHPRQPFRDSRQRTHPLLQSPGCTNRPRFQPHTTGGSTALNSDSSFQSARARSLCDQSETIAPYPPSLNRFFGEACSKACASSKISPIRAAKR